MQTRLNILVTFALTASLCVCGPVAAQDAGEASGQTQTEPTVIEASLTQTVGSSDPIKVGETVQVTFEIEHPPGATISFPDSFSPRRWVLVDAQKKAGAETAKKSIWVATFGVYQPGSTTLEPFEIGVSTAGGTATLTTQPVVIKVISTFADATEEPDFKAPRPGVPVWVDDYTLAYLGGGGLFFALLGFALWWARRREMLKPPPPPPPRAPHEVALEKLGALAGDDLMERGEYMIFWVRLSEAVREYLGRAYGFPPHELTTTEVLGELGDVRWPSGLELVDISGLLRRCDEVKFGGATTTIEESNESLRRGFTIVELTKPRATTTVAPLLPTDQESEEPAAVEDDAPDDSRWAPPGGHQEEE